MIGAAAPPLELIRTVEDVFSVGVPDGVLTADPDLLVILFFLGTRRTLALGFAVLQLSLYRSRRDLSRTTSFCWRLVSFFIKCNLGEGEKS